MPRPFAVVLLALAVVATGIAVAAQKNLVFALPAAVAAVAAAGLLFGEAWQDFWVSPTPARGPPSTPLTAMTLPGAFGSRRFDRGVIVDTLDRLERSGPNPDLPVRSPEEMALILRMPEGAFRDYLRARLGQLELQS